VVEVGQGVSRFKAGDRIASTFFRGWVDGPPTGVLPALGNPVDGVLAEYVVFDQNDAVALPQTLSFEEGATLTCAGVTAWHAVVRISGVRPGQTVLVLGSGGVSVFAAQFAKAAGARVIMTSSSDDKLERARKLGVDSGVNYSRTPDWEQEVLKLTDGRGVHCVVEVGGTGTLARSMRAVGFGGHVCLIGVLAGPQGDTNPMALMVKGASLHGIFVGSRAMLEELSAAVDANRIKPVVDRVFTFDAVRDAFDYQKRGAFGKVVIQI
jgi:NADPH:quinone reductase-like Zn-dependent oxidoreductase